MESYKHSTSFYTYLKSIAKEGYDLRIFGHHILVSTSNKVGVTILNIPKEYYNDLRGEYNGDKRRSKNTKSSKKNYKD